MPKSKLPAHLITVLGVKRCSLCKEAFAKDVKPSLSQAFAEHVRSLHKPLVAKPAPRANGKDKE
jgi:hypothetical protein